jgi:hypothetical protein
MKNFLILFFLLASFTCVFAGNIITTDGQNPNATIDSSGIVSTDQIKSLTGPLSLLENGGLGISIADSTGIATLDAPLQHSVGSLFSISSTSNTIPSNDDIQPVNPQDSSKIMISTPTIAAGVDGQIIIVMGWSDARTVTLQDESNLESSGLALAGSADVTLGSADTITLFYYASTGKWYEISRSDN